MKMPCPSAYVIKLVTLLDPCVCVRHPVAKAMLIHSALSSQMRLYKIIYYVDVIYIYICVYCVYIYIFAMYIYICYIYIYAI